LHDITTLDRRGIPGCAIATEAFQPAAAAQGKALGLTPAIVWVPHPIQNRTPAELIGVAEAAVAKVIAAITG
jgi:hypothetical protein